MHSLYRPGSYLTGDYWDGLLVLPFAARSPAAAAGSRSSATPRDRRRAPTGTSSPRHGSTRLRSTASSPSSGAATSTCATRACATYAEDARPWLRALRGGYDVIMVDAYRQPYIPFYLATREFFELVRDRLAPGGMVIVNVGHPEGSDDLEQVLGRTMAAAFPHVLRDPIEPTNTLLVAGEAPVSAGRFARAAAAAPDWPARAGVAAPARRPPPRRRVYTDDRAPVEWLVDASSSATPMGTDRPDHGLGPAARSLSAADRLRASVVTGPVGRELAFGLDFMVALWRGPLRRQR